MSLKVAAECWPASIGIRALQRRLTQLRNAARLWHNGSGLRGSGLRAREGARRTRQKADPARRRSCPSTATHRLTAAEVRASEATVASLEYRHVPTGALAVLAQRLGKVWASPSTWYHLVRKYGCNLPNSCANVNELRPDAIMARDSRGLPNLCRYRSSTRRRLVRHGRCRAVARVDNFGAEHPATR
jgi:hypothetical protein